MAACWEVKQLIDRATEKVIIDRLEQAHTLLTVNRGNEETAFITRVIDRLPEIEKDIILRKYIQLEATYITHFDIYTDMGVVEGTYKKMRLRALYKIGAALGIVDPDVNPITLSEG
ncbi:hypothetical protein H1230_18810 [Paenibacillus sp. 19GGS1-52]|uniref:hypothetical protein n=1 Tax=Paenibacillus sp. 19GGS1-52 TaxID=2758563 RepID=UPI001EFB2EA8|nr:hypothetical protein [Paenibacillus sp. 19GGS1-52]ULO05161.1 hypothetical protein H1230_18810 [Paenibacillus sp. 19GGS1-52]